MEHSYRVPGGISKGEESGRTFDKRGKEMQTERPLQFCMKCNLLLISLWEKSNAHFSVLFRGKKVKI